MNTWVTQQSNKFFNFLTLTPTPPSLETAKRKLEKDQLRREAELKVAETQRQLAELQKKFKQVLNDNQSLPEHVRLKPEVWTPQPVQGQCVQFHD